MGHGWRAPVDVQRASRQRADMGSNSSAWFSALHSALKLLLDSVQTCASQRVGADLSNPIGLHGVAEKDK